MTLPKALILMDEVIGEHVTEGLKTEHSYLAIGRKVATAMLDSADAHYQAEHQKVINTLFSLIDRLWEMVQHGDYSNGIEANGVDEGSVSAFRMMREFDKEIAEAKVKYLGETK